MIELYNWNYKIVLYKYFFKKMKISLNKKILFSVLLVIYALSSWYIQNYIGDTLGTSSSPLFLILFIWFTIYSIWLNKNKATKICLYALIFFVLSWLLIWYIIYSKAGAINYDIFIPFTLWVIILWLWYKNKLL